MVFENPLSLARKVKLGSLGPLPDVPFNLRTLAEAGVLRPVRPDKLARVARELARWGASPAAGIAGAAITHGEDPMLVDESGALTFGEMHRRSNALARAFADAGSGRATGSRSWPATTAASSTRPWRPRSSAPTGST